MLLEFKDITYKYPGAVNDVFKDLTCNVSTPGFHALFGPSGVGKTTLAKMMIGGVNGFSGEISTSGIDHILYTYNLERLPGWSSVGEHLQSTTPDSGQNRIEELVKARRRGVDVRIIIPLEGYMGPFDRANILGANLLLENGVRVYVYPGQLHAKAAVYDGWACFGSANIDKASFKRNRELNIATSHPKAVDELLDSLFRPDFEISKEIVEKIPQH